jgi:phenylpropionate dioxygenase-like ring-hydroxylating dioxygenase large terminal subunit
LRSSNLTRVPGIDRRDAVLQTKQPVLQRFWNPIAQSAHVADRPVARTYFGVDVVLWRDAAGKVYAQEDRCQHRTAKLSGGWVIRDEHGEGLACPYHGWRYGPGGACIHIPQQPELSAKVCSARAKGRGFACEERYGYVWVCLSDSPLAGIPEFEEEGRGFRRIHQFDERWQTAGLRLMENSFDNAHFAFTHKASFGDMHKPIPASLQLTPTDYGFLFETKVEVRNPEVQKKVLRMDSDTTIRHMRNKWYMPFIRKLHITYPNGIEHSLVTCATPVSDGEIQVLQWAYRSDTEAEAPAADIIAFDRQVTREDMAVLESTDWDAPLDLASGEEKHMPTDQPGMMMRKMLIELLKAHGEDEARRDGRRGVATAQVDAAA